MEVVFEPEIEDPTDEDEKHEMDKVHHGENKRYDENTTYWTRVVYVIAIVIWLIIIIYTKFYTLQASFILVIPFFVFIIGIINASYLCTDVEEYMFAANFLTIGLLLALPLLNWTSKGYNGCKKTFTLIIILAITFSILSMYDIWVPKKWLSVYKHGRSCLQTLS